MEKMETKEVFVPAENISEKKRADKLREKIQTQKEKHRAIEKLKNVKGLAEDSDDDEDALQWYQKQKRLDQEKKAAEKKARLLAEMDEELEQVNAIETKKKRDKAYNSRHLAGLAIGHKVDSIKEGQQIILTLRDNEVLNEGEDVLENVNILDSEKTDKNMENRKQRPDYKPYDDDEFDELGIYKPRSLLGKYDEEIDGPKNDMFRIGQFNASTSSTKQDAPREKLKLSFPDLKVASEYYTAEEMIKFKKPSKRKGAMRTKSRKNAQLQLEAEPNANVNHGSRSKRSKANDGSPIKKASSVKLNPAQLDEEDDDDEDDSYQDLSNIRIEEDFAEKELHLALNKARKLKAIDATQKAIDPAASVARIVESVKTEDDEDEDSKMEDFETVEDDNLVLNATAEFCRNLGDLPKFGESSRHLRTMSDDDEDDEEVKKDPERPMDIDSDEDDEDGRYRNNWNEVELKEEEEDDAQSDVKQEETASRFVSQPILEEEPDVSVGVAGALKLAMNKGYLDKESTKQGGTSRSSNIISAQAYTIEEKFHEEERANRRDRYSNLSDFKEKDTYKPSFKLDYVDEKGRIMTPKESFRYLSHKFHGKGPGKNKIDKRMKKMEQESKLRQMSSTDTPLNTLKLLQDRQKETQAPYIVLSGQNSIAAPAFSKITKRK